MQATYYYVAPLIFSYQLSAGTDNKRKHGLTKPNWLDHANLVAIPAEL